MIQTERYEMKSISHLKQLYADGAITPREVIEAIIAQAEAEQALNIWITPPRMERIRPYLDRLAASSPEQLPLWGIPFAIKDNIDLAGVPTTAACPDYEYIPKQHATVVERLIAAGAIPVGKTNLDQFATGLVGVRSPYGEVHNALRPELISGGSSSGSAVAVARGQVMFALGTDTAGSGRVPAALNGIIGYKPSVGAWPVKGVVPACQSIDCVTVFANTIEDAMQVDQCVRGVDHTDPWSLQRPKVIPALPAKVLLPASQLTFFGDYAEQYREAWQRTVEAVHKLQLPVEYVDLQLFQEAAKLLYEGPFVEERWAALGSFVEAHEGSTLPVTRDILQSGKVKHYTGAAVFQAQHQIQRMKLEAHRKLAHAVMILPTVGGTYTRQQLQEQPVLYNSQLGLYTNHCNLLDLAALSVPGAAAGEDLPFGISLFSLPELEGANVELAARLQRLISQQQQMPQEELTVPSVLVAVCGLHMRGMPLEPQMQQCGAAFVKETKTARAYRLFKLDTEPSKPGLIKVPQEEGCEIAVELWRMPLHSFGSFAAAIPAPLGIGKIELIDGTEVSGFVCEGYAVKNAQDISVLGSWRAAVGS